MRKPEIIHHTALAKSGGATRIAGLIHDGLKAAGYSSSHSFEASENPGDRLIPPDEAARAIPANSIVHLHSSADPALFLNTLPESAHVVITLHDTQMITGGCASPMECENFDRSCRNCPRNFPDSENVRRKQIAAILDSEARLIAPSRWLGQLVQKADPRLKAKIIPNGIPWPEQLTDKNEARREIGIHPSSKVLLFVAHGGEKAVYKSGPEWKKYWEKIKAAVPDALCFAIGGDEHRRDGDFISVPYVDSRTLGQFMRAADVLAYPTLGDNHPLIILESFSFGLAPVSFAVGGVVEQITDGLNGILVPPYEKQKFAEKVTSLLQNRRLAKTLGEQGFFNGKNRYASTRMLNDYIKIYDRLG